MQRPSAVLPRVKNRSWINRQTQRKKWPLLAFGTITKDIEHNYPIRTNYLKISLKTNVLNFIKTNEILILDQYFGAFWWKKGRNEVGCKFLNYLKNTSIITSLPMRSFMR